MLLVFCFNLSKRDPAIKLMVMIRQATAVVIPFMLCVTSWWAFIASFEDDSDIGGPADPGGRWWSSTGLRLFALVPFALAILFGRMVWKRRKRLERTVAVVEVGVESDQRRIVQLRSAYRSS